MEALKGGGFDYDKNEHSTYVKYYVNKLKICTDISTQVNDMYNFLILHIPQYSSSTHSLQLGSLSNFSALHPILISN